MNILVSKQQHHHPTRCGLWIGCVLMWLVSSVYAADVTTIISIKSDPRYQDTALLERAWSLPVAATYRSTFEYQVNPMFCGPATAVNVLKSVGIAKYQQNNVFDASTVTYWKTLAAGLTLDEMATLVHDSSGWNVKVLRDISLAEFREHLKKSNDVTRRYTLNFLRAPLWGGGGGHHSPIGGYMEKEDLVFVLDVYDPFKPFLVTSQRLYESMDTIDGEINKKRGLLLLTK